MLEVRRASRCLQIVAPPCPQTFAPNPARRLLGRSADQRAKALGCLGIVTNGSMRDLAAVAEGFQMLAGSIAPSHAYVRVVEFGISVPIHSMEVRSGDLIHADRHGAVVVPEQSIDAMAAALDGLMKREAKIIAAARVPGATAESIKAAMKE